MVLLDIVVDKVEISEDIVFDGLVEFVVDYFLVWLYSVVNSIFFFKWILVVSYMLLVSYLVDEFCEFYIISFFVIVLVVVIKYFL